VTPEQIHKLALEGAELMRLFLEKEGISTEVIILISPQSEPRLVVSGSTADEESMNIMLSNAMTRLVEDND
jgi:hypothetical protein